MNAGQPEFTPAEETWLAEVELTHKVPLSAEQNAEVLRFFRSATPADAAHNACPPGKNIT
ncbi:hypothetical protein CH296_00285 [Rhodococcus sp. 14-2496-1d]|nr:hypothetical protein CH296_00285 [Rhodococcus sp. 14-2496-1d]